MERSEYTYLLETIQTISSELQRSNVLLCRPTLLLEFIQRIGCVENQQVYQKGGYGGFGKDNVNQIFKSIENYDKSFDTSAPVAP